MKYVLEDLLKVRNYHEISRNNEMLAQKEIFKNTERMVRNKKQQLFEYKAWRVSRENALFEEIKEKQVKLRDLDDLKINIALLRQNEAQLENDLEVAEKALEAAASELEQARNAYYQAVREKKKIEEHRKIWLEEMTVEEERANEKEMEEFHGKMIHVDVREENDEAY